jgi:hypothetical protein
LVNRALALPGIGPMLRETGFSPETALSVTAANSARLAETAGDGWIAIGDAALSFDPIASRGLFNALYTAWSGAMACHDVLTGARDGSRITPMIWRTSGRSTSVISRWSTVPSLDGGTSRSGRAAPSPVSSF